MVLGDSTYPHLTATQIEIIPIISFRFTKTKDRQYFAGLYLATNPQGYWRRREATLQFNDSDIIKCCICRLTISWVQMNGPCINNLRVSRLTGNYDNQLW